ncbi:hypothetical protein [Nitrosopumilus ureiphilus]|uniref:Uncharacterized protein n=1 Tax=Nitrosopumilus ureiphilus TaxID=1470067 RepID=A0A7D5RFS5_9ARCH|nr:hypothetical protein [Nitrosopumilus ureiphilus]QLH05985.1 hypothetical protein C5F50_02020 [Nitrosopumilus ureiphilus]
MTKSIFDYISTISLIFLLSGVGILMTFYVIHVFFEWQFTDGKDIFNWVGLVVEIGIALGIIIAVWYYTRNEQTKTKNLISNIHEITEKLDRVIAEQNKLQSSRKQFLHESCLVI